ncbi:MAG: AI-2E family transporter [Saprospiraceae bacterium]|nr:AI-2E family transporter [Saprospiraceae bacterium]
MMYYINPSRIQSMFTSTVSAFGNMVVGIMSVMFIAFFFLKEQGLFYEMIKTAVPVEYEERTTHAIDESSKLLIRYFIGIFIQITIVTIVSTILLSALGIQNALLIAFFAAIMNVIPYMGPIIGASFGAIITISSNLNVSFYNELFPQLIKVFIVFGIVQLIDNFILQPNIFSKSVKAHPLEIFLIVLIGAKLGGILGMVLAIPLYTVMRVIGKVFLSEFKVIQRLTKNI